MPQPQGFRRAVKWAYVMSLGDKGLSALTMFVLASLLGPREFGIVAMALVYIEFIQMFLDQGFVAAIIQRKELSTRHLNSVYWLVLALSLLLSAVSIACSRWWAALNHVPELALVLCALSISIPIEALTVVQKAVLHREMDFKSMSLRSSISVLIGGFVGVGLALSDFKIWALVGQIIIRDLAALALLWKLSHWRPQFRFSISSIKELLGFSLPNFTAKLGVFASGQVDAFLIGLFFSPVAVGLYRLADRIVSMVLEVATRSLQVVSFPQFSRLQDQPAELKRSVLACLRMSAMTTVPVLTGIALSSNLLVAAIGPKWTDAATPLKILCVVGIALVFAQFTGPLLQALSKPQLLAILTWVLAGASVTALVAAGFLLKSYPVHEQLLGVAAARFVSSAMMFAPALLFILARQSGISIGEFCSAVAPSFAAASVVAGAVFLLSASGLLADWKPLPALMLRASLCGSLAGATLLLVDLDFRRQVTLLVRQRLTNSVVTSEAT